MRFFPRLSAVTAIAVICYTLHTEPRLHARWDRRRDCGEALSKLPDNIKEKLISFYQLNQEDKPEQKLRGKYNTLPPRLHLISCTDEEYADLIYNDYKTVGKEIEKEKAREISSTIHYFTGKGFTKIRDIQKRTVRGTAEETEYMEKIRAIEEYLTFAPPYPGRKTLYRGLKGAAAFVRFSNSAIGDIYQEGALTSSSLKRSIAFSFSGKGKKKNNGVLIKFDGGIPKGATSARGISQFKSESEVLFSGKNQYEIIKKEMCKLKETDKHETLILTVKYIGREGEKT